MIFLYMARRDKKEVRILSTFQGDGVSPTVIEISKLNIPEPFASEITATVQENRMFWEVLIESATDYGQLRSKLVNRGYRNVPFKGVPMHQVRSVSTIADKNNVVTANMNIKRTTSMVQRRSPNASRKPLLS